MNEQERAVKCIDKIKETLEEYGFIVAADMTHAVVIEDRETGNSYDLE